MSDSIMDDAEVLQPTETDADTLGARIKVLGVGGGGGNAVQHMIEKGLPGVEFVCANTDKQALNKSSAEQKIQLGVQLTKGRGAGSNPKVGREAAMESINAIRDSIGDAEMLFITAGMGGGTGTGGAPVVAQVAREMNVLTVGVVTKPFEFEGQKRAKAAEEGLSELRQYVDCLITIPNERLINFAPKKASFADMLEKSNEVLYQAVKGISDVVNAEGLINLDFADVRTTMQEAGMALMGTGAGTGENRAREAAQRAIASPLLEDISLDSAKAILYNITGPRDITINEVQEVGTLIREAAPEDCSIIFGVVFDDAIGDDLYVTLIATGIEPPDPSIVESPQHVKRVDLRKKRAVNEVDQPTAVPQTKVAQQAQRRRPSVSSLEDYENEAITQNLDDQDYGADSLRVSPLRRTQGTQRRQQHTPGADMFTYEDERGGETNFDIPAFIRRQAN